MSFRESLEEFVRLDVEIKELQHKLRLRFEAQNNLAREILPVMPSESPVSIVVDEQNLAIETIGTEWGEQPPREALLIRDLCSVAEIEAEVGKQ